jgi:hypothetical protein
MNFLQFSATSSLQGPNIFLSTLFSKHSQEISCISSKSRHILQILLPPFSKNLAYRNIRSSKSHVHFPLRRSKESVHIKGPV